ncbi:MAG TPA: trypsin-like peptidase domain-containing protein [Mycobacteriales bacterium]|nr:trypsin-like peptidase domain-containing protein [Mycobacteriales bacterium]
MADETPPDDGRARPDRVGRPANIEAAAPADADARPAGDATPGETDAGRLGPRGTDPGGVTGTAGVQPPAGTGVVHGRDPDDPALPGGDWLEATVRTNPVPGRPPGPPPAGGYEPLAGQPRYAGPAGPPPRQPHPPANQPPAGQRPQGQAAQGQPAQLLAPPAGPPPLGSRPSVTSPQPPRPRRRTGTVLAAVLVAGVVGGGVGAAVDRAVFGQRTVVSALAAPPLATQDTAAAPAGSVQQVAEAVLPSVVSVEVDNGQTSGEGSGVILTSDGLILTNNHVVAEASGGRMTVRFHDGRSATGEVVGLDATTDLAVIRARGVDNLRPATFGRSGDLKVGQPVVAIGSPLGLSGTVTSGIVSALNRPVRTGDAQSTSTDTVIDAIQTDAAINPGNSGGALVDLRGEVVGINSAIATLGSSGRGTGGQAGNIGLGFAIPSDEAQPVAQQLAQAGKASHAQLGVSVQDSGTTTNGGTLLQVTANGPAAKAGLRAGDVVTKVGDRQIDSADALVAAVRSHRPGDQITLTYLRNGQTKTTKVTLGGKG